MDVYFGLKKDLHKRNFAFVRFVGIKDAKEMELKVQGIKCRGKTLEVNISKHQRKTQQYQHQVPRRQPMQSNNMQPNVYHSAQPYYTEERGNKTYAQAASNSNVEKPQQHTYPIILNPNTFMRDWLKKGVLIGETHSLDHMANLHALGIIKEETKYLGGLKLAIHFRWSAVPRR
ncbi:unnamed protein product [Lactuca virosa]|uniref:RRM domain-containing protein n=1 Tax=Lactuca virosa TaxID=75947 RepID=A0AAU9LTJ2_9ASTR|nr:unnamed protein product [Lactuca virosa]